MTTITEKTPSTLAEFLEIIGSLQLDCHPDPLWYRGCNQSSYDLIPSLYRHSEYKTGEEFLDLENKIIKRFSQRSIPYIAHPFTDNWSKLFFMQHYGIPTRLLDWSENPLIALYFSVMNNEKTRDHRVKQDAAVWVLNPISWNLKVLDHVMKQGEILSPGDNALQAYEPLSRVEDVNEEPVAIFGEYNSNRVVAQQGVFVIFGKNTRAMNKSCTSSKFQPDTLTKIIIKKDVVNEFRRALHLQGTIETVIYPDLSGVALEIKRFFHFL